MTRFSALLGLLLALAVGCGDKQEATSQSGGRDQLAAVIKGLDNPFFQTMRDGLVATARGHGARLRIEAAAGLEDVAGQASKLESLARAKAACYVVNPINATNLIQPLADLPKGAPIVNIDSPVDADAARAVGVKITTYVGTDNVAAGRAGAGAMARFVGDGATVAVVTGIPGDVSSRDRTDGFMEAAEGRFAIGPTVPADFDRDRARVAAAELLRTNPGIRGFFAVNDEMALGIADAVQAGGRRGAVAVIGVDGILDALAGIRRGAMSATVAQYPYTIGQLGIEACLAATGGAALPSRIDSPVQVVTKSNVARARANFPKPVERFKDPVVRLVDGER